MAKIIRGQSRVHLTFYTLFALASVFLMIYYLSDTIIHFTSNQQFPINSFERFPLTFLIFPAELFSFFFVMYFVYNLVHGNYTAPKPHPLKDKHKTPVALLLPVFNEPKEIVTRTLNALSKVRWDGGTTIYLLDDSNNEEDRENMLSLSKRFGCVLVRRPTNRGYKAGNINHAIKNAVKEEFFAIFDSDQAPEPHFLEETMDHFSDRSVGFVQTPQHFINQDTPLERAAKMGTDIFYHTQCVSKARDGAMPFCGTNVIVRKDAFVCVNGFSYYTSTEDIDLGIRMNEAGYLGVYVPTILVHGYAPSHYGAYTSQQYRWANGNLAILRESWPKLLFGRFSLRYQLHTFFTLGWWLVGIITFLYLFVPILSFFVGGTHHTWLPSALLFLLLLNGMMGIAMIYAALHNRIDGEKVTPADAFLQYSLITNSMFIYAKAALAAFIGKYAGFVRTEKKRIGSDIRQIKWNLLFSVVCFGFSIFALYHSSIASDIQQIRTYFPLSLWLLFYSIVLASSILFIEKTPVRDALPLAKPSRARPTHAIGSFR